MEFPIRYVIDGRTGMRTASADDLSVGGLRLLGDEDITHETIVDFRFTLPNDAIASVYLEKEVEERTVFGRRMKRVKVPPTKFEPMEMAGKVVIARFNVRSLKFAHGVRFLDVDRRTEEELQRFVHLYQLKQLRERAERQSYA